MARLNGATSPDAAQELLEQINAYPLRDSVAFWHLGNHLGRGRTIALRRQELANVREAISAVRNLDDQVSHLTLATVDGDLGLFARAPSGLDMIAIEPRFWGACQDLLENYTYMRQRRSLTVRSNLGLLVLGLDSGVDPRRGRAQHLGRRYAAFVGISAGSAHPAQADDLPDACRRVSRNRLSGRRRADTGHRGWPRISASRWRSSISRWTFASRCWRRTNRRSATTASSIPSRSPLPSNATQLPNRRPQQVKEQTARAGMMASAIRPARLKGCPAARG